MTKCCGVHTLRIALGITILVLLLVVNAGAMTITVNASGGGDYTKIQEAIDNASAGDTILVYSGIYSENVNVTKQLTLRGIGNPVVDAAGSGSAITLAANGITLEGFTANGSDYPEAGVKLTSSNNTLIGNNVSNNNYNGIVLVNSNNNTLTGNNASNNTIGIYLSYSSNNTLSGNNAGSNNGYGIILKHSRKNTLKGNNASNNGNGIYLWFSSNRNTLSDNNASNNYGGGISVYSSSNNTLSNNMMTNFNLDGNTDSDFENHIDKGNLVDGRPIYYIIKASDMTYDSSSNAGTFYCISCVNVTIKNLNLNNNGKGIFFWNTTNSRIQNVNASNNGYGIYFFSSSNNTVIGNNVSKNSVGISLKRYSNNNNLTGNKASNNLNGPGIHLSSSNKNTLIGNKASNNYYGIYLYYSSNNTLTGNNASNNGGSYYSAGISLSYSSNNKLIANNASNNYVGITLRDSCSKNTLAGNNASNNVESGIYLISSNNIYNNTLTSNNISNNKYGISLDNFNKNKIYNNIFNNIKNLNLYHSKNNKWNTTRQLGTNIIGRPYIGGNFWENPNGTGFSQTCKDVNGDGICDKSYVLDENNIDYLPLAKDKIPPKSITKLKNITYAKNYINWTWKDPKDIDFKKVMVFIDGKFQRNVSKGKRYFNATNFTANTKHTISTRTVDMNGNINKTWANHSAWTAK